MVAVEREPARFEISQRDPRYPSVLLRLETPPECLYVVGDPHALSIASVAVIGARKATPYGTACAKLTARAAAQWGLGVVSGAAIGCDQAAMREALAQGCTVVAVLGCGADVVYPSSARDLLRDVVRLGGAVVSLQEWGAPPVPWAFVRRNAVIAALGRVLVVTEAGMPSGTMGTTLVANDLEREVAVFPGAIFSKNSAGSNYLIANGATIIHDEQAVDVLFSRVVGAELHLREGSCSNNFAKIALDDNEQAVMNALCACPTTPSSLAHDLQLDIVQLMRMLASLEARGLVTRLADGRYALAESAMLRQNWCVGAAQPSSDGYMEGTREGT